jgi:hypothetical protein
VEGGPQQEEMGYWRRTFERWDILVLTSASVVFFPQAQSHGSSHSETNSQMNLSFFKLSSQVFVTAAKQTGTRADLVKEASRHSGQRTLAVV